MFIKTNLIFFTPHLLAPSSFPLFIYNGAMKLRFKIFIMNMAQKGRDWLAGKERKKKVRHGKSSGVSRVNEN